jgi:hypothetical protein
VASIHKQSNRSYWFAAYRDADGRQHSVSTKILHTPSGNDAKELAGNAAKNRRLAQDMAMRLARILHALSWRDAVRARLARRPKRFRAGLYVDILSGEEREANSSDRNDLAPSMMLRTWVEYGFTKTAL